MMPDVRKLTVVVAVAAGLATLGACKDDPPIEAFVDEYCGTLQPCCGPSKPGEGTKGSGCRAFYSLFGGSSYVEAKGDACLAEIRANRADPTFCSRVSQLAPSCGQAFASNTGTKALGEDCSTSRECAPSNEGTVECNLGKTGGRSTCKLEIVGKEGDTPCAQTRNTARAVSSGSTSDENRSFICDVATGLYCNLTTKACERTKALGEACSGANTTYPCGAAATCSGGKCVAQPPSSGGPTSTDPSLLFVCSTSD